MTNYEELVKKHTERVNLYSMSLAALALILIAISLPSLVVYAQEPPEPIDQFAKIEMILYSGLTILGIALAIISRFLNKYKLGGAATATAMLNFSQKTIENIGDITLFARTMNKLTDGKLQTELERENANIDLLDEKLKVGVEQFEVLKPLILKYLGEDTDPNVKELPRESKKPVNVFPPAVARATGGKPLDK